MNASNINIKNGKYKKKRKKMQVETKKTESIVTLSG